MDSRNRHLARQLRAAMRASRWSAGTIALRLHLSREMMVRVLLGDEEVSLRIYQMVAEELDCDIECVSFASVRALVTADPEILRGTPVFTGTRVPITNVLASLDKGIGLERLKEAYPLLTPAHVRAARWHTSEHPQAASHQLIETLVGAVQRRMRTIVAGDRVN